MNKNVSWRCSSYSPSSMAKHHHGFPSPNVTWSKDNKLWDNTFKKVGGNVVNEMRLFQLNRSELFATFHCKAQNTKLSPPVTQNHRPRPIP
ncbi:uncharacterized protein CEXT_405641 [Caerostris extrusa]|uniref:Ig-like domain-containing protein n=1 Tax=Caerostris extrusa TaxID=172846 RepID=A0AAV4UIG5_CAEEX|nr:uncharacterized protein CEXT_405641 [Caerostris extrusa]